MFRILVLNIGSTSLKFSFFDMSSDRVLAKGNIENIGCSTSPMSYYLEEQSIVHRVISTVEGYGVGIKVVLELILEDKGLLNNISDLKAISFKTVHAGEATEPALITDQIIEQMEDYNSVVPAHNPPYLKAIRQCRELFPGVPLVAVFETDFHKDMPDYARIYSVPFEWYRDHGIRRYGFHGSSHRYIVERSAKLLNRPIENTKIISCHLGGSSSITAVKNGKSIDQSMGFSAQAGIPMSTRCGDIDPFIIPYIMKKTNLSFEEVMSILAGSSGLLGISGISGDMRELEGNYQKDYRAKLAIDSFCYSVKKYIASYMAILEGADALVFTGGIGENSPTIRERVCRGMQFMGIDLDAHINREEMKGGRAVSTASSRVKILIMPTNEELIVARETVKVLDELLLQSAFKDSIKGGMLNL